MSSSISGPTCSSSGTASYWTASAKLENSRQQLATAQQEHVAALERVSGMTAAEAKAQLLEAVRDEPSTTPFRIGKAIERAARDEAEDRAREIVITSMQRVAADHTAEHTVSAVHLAQR